MFLFEPFFFKPVGYFFHFGDALEGLYFGLYVATFQGKHTIGHGVALCGGDVFLYYFHQVGQWHNGSCDNKVKLSFFFFTTQVFSHNVV